ncbi:MAG: beta-lactamase family protein [Lentimicrobiaceae bacterium]|nr:beta-lactamase family protein [Lentimicrobiaceae bacterium]
MKRIIIILSIIIVFTGCLKDKNLKTDDITYIPIQLNDGWKINTATAQIFDMRIFNEVMSLVYSNDDLVLIRSLVIVKNGELVAEAYPRTQFDRTAPRHLWSVTKSFMSMLTGIAYDQGYIRSVSDLVFSYIPEYLQYTYPQLAPLTIEECLTMRSGIDYSNDGQEEEDLLAMVPNDLTQYILNRPMKYLPGKIADYKNSDPQLLVKVISNATKTDFVEFAEQNLFKPLGITNYYWSRNKDNTPYGGFGLFLTPRDMAKTGQMLLDNGVWNNQRILSEEWINKATSSKTNIRGFDYGYYFWIDVKQNIFWAWGARGQFVFVIPDKELIVVITSEQFAGNDLGTSIEEATFLVDKIIESIREY